MTQHESTQNSKVGKISQIDKKKMSTYLSNRSITSVMPWAVGCLTGERSLFKIYICCVWMDDGTDDRMDDVTDGWMESFISSTTLFTI
jgi:hypothetical protein